MRQFRRFAHVNAAANCFYHFVIAIQMQSCQTLVVFAVRQIKLNKNESQVKYVVIYLQLCSIQMNFARLLERNHDI